MLEQGKREVVKIARSEKRETPRVAYVEAPLEALAVFAAADVAQKRPERFERESGSARFAQKIALNAKRAIQIENARQSREWHL